MTDLRHTQKTSSTTACLVIHSSKNASAITENAQLMKLTAQVASLRGPNDDTTRLERQLATIVNQTHSTNITNPPRFPRRTGTPLTEGVRPNLSHLMAQAGGKVPIGTTSLPRARRRGGRDGSN